MKSGQMAPRGLSKQALWFAFRDTGIYAIGFVVVSQVTTLLKHNYFIHYSARHIRIGIMIFAIVWFANFIGCSLGCTTLTDDEDDLRSGLAARIPTTLAISGVVGLVSFILLLLGGMIV